MSNVRMSESIKRAARRVSVQFKLSARSDSAFPSASGAVMET